MAEIVVTWGIREHNACFEAEGMGVGVAPLIGEEAGRDPKGWKQVFRPQTQIRWHRGQVMQAYPRS